MLLFEGILDVMKLSSGRNRVPALFTERTDFRDFLNNKPMKVVAYLFATFSSGIQLKAELLGNNGSFTTWDTKDLLMFRDLLQGKYKHIRLEKELSFKGCDGGTVLEPEISHMGMSSQQICTMFREALEKLFERIQERPFRKGDMIVLKF